MDNVPAPPAAPPPDGKAPRKSHLGLIVGGAAILFVLYLISGSGHGGSKSSVGVSGAPESASADAGSAPVAVAAPTAAGANPILGRWTLLDTDATYCQSFQEFSAGGSTTVRAGVTSTGHPIYNMQPKFVDVSYGGPNFEQWDVNGPDDLTLELISPYSVTSCRYHRI
jgi:hypothetical protein